MAQNPLLGKRISLISKKNIRYEGLLYSINEQNMTLALQNVRSYGTEGRELEPVTDPTTGAVVSTGQFVPPNDDVHAYLLFRGQDIKDLHVHESQPVPEPTPAPSVPAPPPTVTAVPQETTAPEPAAPTTTEDTTSTHPNRAKAGRSGGRGGRGPRPKPLPEVAGVGTGASLLSPQERSATTAKIEDFEFATEAATEDAPAPNVAAYAKDDFFDSISCEALDKQAGVDNRLRGNQERRLNTETFGAVALNNNNRRRPGRGGAYSGGRGSGRAVHNNNEAGRASRGSYRGDGGRSRGSGRGRGRSMGRGPSRGGGRSEGMPRPAATTASS